MRKPAINALWRSIYLANGTLHKQIQLLKDKRSIQRAIDKPIIISIAFLRKILNDRK